MNATIDEDTIQRTVNANEGGDLRKSTQTGGARPTHFTYTVHPVAEEY